MHRRKFLSLAVALSALPLPALGLPRAPEARRIRLKNAHTGEIFSGTYRDADGRPLAAAMDDLSLFLRDHYSGAVIPMDPGVVDFLGDVAAAVGEDQATVLSAYRTPETNAMLAKTNFGVAENSQHMYGRALDVFFGERLEDAMTRARAMKRGGVGWYPRSNFIHLDTGPVRNWNMDETGLDDLLLQDKPMIIGGAHSPLMFRGARVPLTVAQRLALHRRLAHVEFLARRI
jgi:uncharacterized protein YcbK (DUF882 family)